MTSDRSSQRRNAAAGVLLLGAVIYGCLCLPAIRTSGRGPLDPAWLAVVHLWIVPVIVAAVFDCRPSWHRTSLLIGYALFTSFCEAGTFRWVVPQYVSWTDMFQGMLQGGGLLHVIGTFAAEWTVRWLLRRAQRGDPRRVAVGRSPRMPFVANVIGWGALGIAIAYPFVARTIVFTSARLSGRTYADQAWAAGQAGIYGNFFEQIVTGEMTAIMFFDRETGLERRGASRRDYGVIDAYNARIQELIASDGIPLWSLKPHVPSAEGLAALFDADDYTEVTSFPASLTPRVTLIIKAGRERRELCLEAGDRLTPFGGLTPEDRILVRVGEPLVVIRIGADQLCIVHKDGRLVAEASRGR